MNNVCQYCLLDAETDEELAEEIKALGEIESYGGDDCVICGG